MACPSSIGLGSAMPATDKMVNMKESWLGRSNWGYCVNWFIVSGHVKVGGVGDMGEEEAE